MDSDLVIQRLWQGALFLGGAFVLGAAAMWLMGVACRRAGLGNGLTTLAQVLTPVVLVCAGSLYLDAAGVVAHATVLRTDERINHSYRLPGAWHRWFWATVRFTSTDGPAEAVLWIDEAHYDALVAGQALDVRYVTAFPFLARPADESTRALVPWRFLAGAAVVWSLGLTLWLALRKRRPALFAVLAFVAVFAGVVWWVFPTPWDTPLEGPVAAIDAEVVAVRDVTRSFVSGRSTGPVDAPQPWQVVELRFVPQGRERPVIAVDEVDAGSVDGLRRGARVPVTYSLGSPRDARLDGRRSYRWREWLELGTYLAVVAGICVGVMVAGRLVSWWWRRMLGSR